MGEQVMCGSVYAYILTIHHYAPNIFSAFPNLPNRWILANNKCESQSSQFLVNLYENTRECRWIFNICLFSAFIRLKIAIPNKFVIFHHITSWTCVSWLIVISSLRRECTYHTVSSTVVLNHPSHSPSCMFVLPSWNIHCHCWMFLRFITFYSS